MGVGVFGVPGEEVEGLGLPSGSVGSSGGPLDGTILCFGERTTSHLCVLFLCVLGGPWMRGCSRSSALDKVPIQL